MNNKDKAIKERFDAWYEEGKSIAKAIKDSGDENIDTFSMLDMISSGIDICTDKPINDTCATMYSRSEADLYDDEDDEDDR